MSVEFPDRTGQVWTDKSSFDDMFLVIGPPKIDKEGDALHPVVMLDAKHTQPGSVNSWYEFQFMYEWEADPDMTRLA